MEKRFYKKSRGDKRGDTYLSCCPLVFYGFGVEARNFVNFVNGQKEDKTKSIEKQRIIKLI